MRLKSLACGDKKLVYTTFDKEFASFSQLTNNSWSSESSNNLDLSLFWLNHNNKVYLKVLRCQLSNGLCSMNAAVVLQHYLVTINEPDDAQNLGMLNLGKYIGATLKARDLETYLTTPTDLPTGGTTISFLKKSCGLTSRDLYHISIPIITESTLHLVEARDQICEEVMRRLKYQPALISSFIVNKNFTRLGSISFTTGPDFDSDWGLQYNNDIDSEDEAEGECIHAIVLAGMRKDLNGKYFFLLQNWWKDRYFIEMSADYFAASPPKVTYVHVYMLYTVYRVYCVLSAYNLNLTLLTLISLYYTVH